MHKVQLVTESNKTWKNDQNKNI